jgi:hypothetical protein
MITSARSWWRVDLYVSSLTVSLIDWIDFLEGVV